LLQFVNNNQALATLPGDGVGQNLITLAPCAINQPHVHPRGTEISHITKGKPRGSPTLSAQVACNWQAAPSLTLKYINSVCGAAISIWPATPRLFDAKKPSAHTHLHEQQYC